MKPLHGETFENYHRRLAEAMEKKVEKALDKPRKVWILLEYRHDGPHMKTKELVGLHVFDSEQKAYDKKTELSQEWGQKWVSGDIISKEIR